jgi:D-alanyl-D-alanine carboxypeptidase (penicillin-binding protein 5/6)
MEKIEKEEWSLDTKLVTSEYAASMYGSQAFLDAGQEYTVEELFKSVVIASANDSSVVLAEGYAGTEENFVAVMNKRAKELGLENTAYANSTGLPSSSQYSTAQDVAKLLCEVAKHDLYHKYSTIWMDKIIHKSGRETELVNTNRLVRYFPGCDCGKTGFTDEAGYCLSASAKRNNMRMIAVVMGANNSEERFTSTASLLNYGFSNYENKQYVNTDKTIDAGVKVRGISEQLQARSEKDMYVLSKRGDDKKNVTISVQFNKKLKAPICKDEVVGKIYLIEDGIVVDEANILSVKDYNKLTYGQIIKKVAGEFRFLG